MRSLRTTTLLATWAVTTALLSASTNARAQAPSSPAEAPALARQILDDSRPEADRKRIIADNPQLSLPLLRALVADMPVGDSKEQYRRIPWIWRVTVAAGKRNQVNELRPIVDLCVPQMKQPLLDWQAVVLGGGVINGIGLSGGWPDEQLRAIVAGNSDLTQRWSRVLKLAAVMADNQKVFKGTRYDALRILGLDTWNHRGAQLFRYLVKGVDDELQQGAIGGLSDMRSPCVAPALLSGFPHYEPRKCIVASPCEGHCCPRPRPNLPTRAVRGDSGRNGESGRPGRGAAHALDQQPRPVDPRTLAAVLLPGTMD